MGAEQQPGRAAHRLAVLHELEEGIDNHFTVTVPGTEDRYLILPFGLHWSEITASCFLEVSYAGKILNIYQKMLTFKAGLTKDRVG